MITTSINPPPIGVEVIGFHPDWIDLDYNPNGWRICFRNGDGSIWISSVWDNVLDYYHTDDTCKAPIIHFFLPKKPLDEKIHSNGDGLHTPPLFG